jgi:hypothetical protein
MTDTPPAAPATNVATSQPNDTLTRVEAAVKDALSKHDELESLVGSGALANTSEIATVVGKTLDPPSLPTWTDATSVATYITALVSIACGGVALFHPGFTEPTLVQALVTPVGVLVSGLAMVANVVRHTKVHVAAFASHAANSYAAPTTNVTVNPK